VNKDVSEKPDVNTFRAEVNNTVTRRLKAGIVGQEELSVVEKSPFAVGD
jgi:hypothetical protein